jgi:hypothetical protein
VSRLKKLIDASRVMMGRLSAPMAVLGAAAKAASAGVYQWEE